MTAQLALLGRPTGTATFSPCGRYRYTLTRELGEGAGTALWVMLNPSTATAEANDPTVRRVIDFARRDGFSRLVVCNLYAFRSTDPKGMPRDAAERSGPDNLRTLAEQATVADRVVVAWGSWGARWPGDVADAVEVLSPWCCDEGCRTCTPRRPLWCLGTTTSGQPLHPLYQPGAAPLVPWRMP